MASLTLAIIVCTFVSLGDSCFFEPLQPGATNCTDSADNSTHQFETSWKTGKCIECYCSDSGMACCETMATVINQTEGCVVEYNYSTCTFNVFNPFDPSFDCAYSAVEK